MANELWWESPEGEWFWYAQDGNWYPENRHPQGVPPEVRSNTNDPGETSEAELGNSTKGAVTSEAELSNSSQKVEMPVSLNPWERARSNQVLTAKPSMESNLNVSKTTESNLSTATGKLEPSLDNEAANVEVGGFLASTRGKIIACLAVFVLTSIIFVAPTVAMVVRKPQPFLTPGETLARNFKLAVYPNEAVTRWVDLAANDIGSIYDDRQVLQNEIIEVAYTQGHKGQATLLDGCLELSQQVKQLSRLGVATPIKLKGYVTTMDFYFTKTANDCLAGLTGQSALYLSQAATDSGPATNAMNELIAKIQALGKSAKN